MRRVILTVILTIVATYFNTICAQTSQQEYFKQYQDLAKRQMEKFGVPASIILEIGRAHV